MSKTQEYCEFYKGYTIRPWTGQTALWAVVDVASCAFDVKFKSRAAARLYIDGLVDHERKD